MQTSTDYPTAYMKEKARADELQNMLDNQIAHTARACRESDSLCREINRLREALRPLAECHLPPTGFEPQGVTAHFSTAQIAAAKNAMVPNAALSSGPRKD